METPDAIELRKRKEIEDAMETGGDTPALYTVLAEKRAQVGSALMGSAHTYELVTSKKTEGVEITLDPSELELEPAAMAAKYDDSIKEREALREDLSDMVAEHAAKKVKYILYIILIKKIICYFYKSKVYISHYLFIFSILYFFCSNYLTFVLLYFSFLVDEKYSC